MTKDFKTSTVNQPKVGQYGMSWMFGGIAIGLLVGLFVYIVINQDIDSLPNTGDSAVNANTSSNGTTLETPLMQANATHPNADNKGSDSFEQPNFSYHAVLPQLGVPLSTPAETPKPEKALNASTPKPAPETKETTPKAVIAKLGKFNGFQVGSYKTHAQASSMQARLKQNGLSTHVEKAEVNGQDYYRIKLGPTTSADVYNKWQQTLSSMGINPLPVRM